MVAFMNFIMGHRKTPVFRQHAELTLLIYKNPSYYVRKTLSYSQCVQKRSL